MTPPTRFILASSSPRRRELLVSLGITFEIIKPDVDETQLTDEDPYAYVQRLSKLKAKAVAASVQGEAIILAADTIVIHEGEILGKPVDTDDARATLQRLRNREHEVCTAFTVLKAGDRGIAPTIETHSIKTAVHMRDYTDAEIDTYIASGDPFDKAGSYAIQNEVFHPVERIDGSYNNVVGLPIETVAAVLRRWQVL